MKLSNILEWYTEDKWTTKAAARDSVGNSISPVSEYAVKFDLYSAITVSIGKAEIREDYLSRIKTLAQSSYKVGGKYLYEIADNLTYEQTKWLIDLL